MNSQLGTQTKTRSDLRRAFVASLVTTVVMGIGLLAGCAPSVGLIGGACAAGFVECGGACVDVSENHDNCGACGHVCNGAAQCGGGVCQPMQSASAITSCAADNAYCDGDASCRDVQHDPSNCGSCGMRCAAGDICAAGACATPRLRDCTPDNVRCGEACRDIRFDPSNCGACGEHCAATDRCTDGVCVPRVRCAEGSAVCEGKCSDPQTDVTNCGACGTACANDEICFGGECLAKKQCSRSAQ